MKVDGSRTFAQDRNTTDNCEEHFCNIRMRNGSANAQNCEQATSHAQTVRSNTFSIKGTSNTAGKRKESCTELMSPLYKRKKK